MRCKVNNNDDDNNNNNNDDDDKEMEPLGGNRINTHIKGKERSLSLVYPIAHFNDAISKEKPSADI